MRFQLGHPIMSRMQEYLAYNFDGSVWGANGPLAVTDVLMDACKVSHADDMTPERCLGVTVLNHTAFYAIPYYAWNDIFDPDKTDDVLAELRGSHALHMWGRFSATAAGRSPTYTKNAFQTIAASSCPMTYKLFDDL